MKKLINLIFSQFIGIFCEYACKILVFSLATRPLWSSDQPELVASLSAIAFLIPKMIFSVPAGYLADRYCKRSIMIATKWAEVLILIFSAAFLYVLPQNFYLPFIILSLMGIQSAIYNPAKSGIIPELVPIENLNLSNGWIEMFSMAAIFCGTAAGPLFLVADNNGSLPHLTCMAPLLLAIISSIGLIVTIGIPRPKRLITVTESSLGAIFSGWRVILTNYTLALTVGLGVIFWIFMSFVGQTVLVMAKNMVDEEIYQGIPLGIFWLGIAIGALYGGVFSNKLSTYTAIIMLFFLPAWMITASLSFFKMMFLLIMLGCASGILLIPLQSLLQAHAPEKSRGSIIASSNILNIKGILIGSCLNYLFC